MTLASQPPLQASANDAPTGRAREIQDPLNRYLYHPLAARLARLLQPTGISPNAVSGAGLLLICAAAWCYTQVGWPTGALAGFGCHLLWHVVDGADGDLARLTGKASPAGEFVDGFCDYLGHIILYVALAAMLDDRIGGWAWLLAAAAGASRVVQSNHTESQRRSFLWRVYGIPWLKNAESGGKTAFSGRNWLSQASERLIRGYLALAEWTSPSSARIDVLLVEAAGDGDKLAERRRLVRQASQGSFFLQKALGANPRTVLLGLSMLAGSPLWFFLAEAVALNGVLAVSLVHHNRMGRRLVAELS